MTVNQVPTLNRFQKLFVTGLVVLTGVMLVKVSLQTNSLVSAAKADNARRNAEIEQTIQEMKQDSERATKQ
jgi:hypothetical protein